MYKYAHISIYVYRCDLMKFGMLLSLPLTMANKGEAQAPCKNP